MTGKANTRSTRSGMSRPMGSSSPDEPSQFFKPKKVSTDRVEKNSTRKKQPVDTGYQETPTKGATGLLSNMNLDSPTTDLRMSPPKMGAFDFRIGAPPKSHKGNVIYSEENDDDDEAAAFWGYDEGESDNEYDNDELDSGMHTDSNLKVEPDDSEFVGPNHPSIPKSKSNMDKFRKKGKATEEDPNGRKKGRKLVMWHRARMMEKLLLNLQYESHIAGIKLPWDATIQRLNPGSGGPSAVQMLNKVRDQLIMEGHMIPPTMGKGHDYHESIRGFIRDMDGPTPTTTKVVRWSDKCDNRKESLQDHGMVRGSGKYRQAEMMGIAITKVPRTQKDRGGPRNLIPRELVEQMSKMKKLKDLKATRAKSVKKRGPYKPRPKDSKIKSEKYIKSEDEEEDEDSLGNQDSDDEYEPLTKRKGRKNTRIPRITLDQELHDAEFASDQPDSSIDEMPVKANDKSLLVKLKLKPRNLAKFPSGCSLNRANVEEYEESSDDSMHRQDPIRRSLEFEMNRSTETMTSRYSQAPYAYSQEAHRYESNPPGRIFDDVNYHHGPRYQPNYAQQQGAQASAYGDQYQSDEQQYIQQDGAQASAYSNQYGDEQDWTDIDESMIDIPNTNYSRIAEPVTHGTNMTDGYAVTYDRPVRNLPRQFIFDTQRVGNHYEQQESIFEGAEYEDPHADRNPEGHFMYVEGQIYDEIEENRVVTEADGRAAYEAWVAAGGVSPTDALMNYGISRHYDDYNENSHHSGETIREHASSSNQGAYFDDGGGFDFE